MSSAHCTPIATCTTSVQPDPRELRAHASVAPGQIRVIHIQHMSAPAPTGHAGTSHGDSGRSCSRTGHHETSAQCSGARQQQVAKQLEKDESLGVIERVPPNTPVTWLHNMVLTPKADGSPRRTIDLQPLNRHSVRETHHTIPPAKQARAIPPETHKTVTDAWNGFHSIEIRQEDRHKTTFLTEQGRYRYRRAPMGFLTSQDAYSDRYDRIIADVPRKSKVVDDTVIWGCDLRTHWSRVLE